LDKDENEDPELKALKTKLHELKQSTESKNKEIVELNKQKDS